MHTAEAWPAANSVQGSLFTCIINHVTEMYTENIYMSPIITVCIGKDTDPCLTDWYLSISLTRLTGYECLFYMYCS